MQEEGSAGRTGPGSLSPPPGLFERTAEIYDEDMGLNPAGADVEFYVSACRGAQAPVLELGCGTGRVTLPLVRAGLHVVGIDTSPAMLRVLARKAAGLTPEERGRLRWHELDMRRATFDVRFSFILCPFSAFTALTAEADQRSVLEMVRAHLAPGGRFLLDVFVPDPRLRELPDDHVFHDYRRQRPDGTTLERTKVIAKDVAPRVNLLTRRYRVLDAAGAELDAFTTTERVRYFSPDELTGLLGRAGFEVEEVQGDFSGGPVGPSTRTAAFRCRPRG
jgi:SAM-dependent methyltransferase